MYDKKIGEQIPRFVFNIQNMTQNEPKINTKKSLSPKKEKNTILNENFQSIFIGG